MAKNKSNGISPIGKVLILCVLFGIPLLFYATQKGLGILFDVAPKAIILVLVVFATVYTTQTVKLLYQYYDTEPPFTRFIPCICELTVTDIKYHKPCYILYALTLVFLVVSKLPYSVTKVLGESISMNLPFIAMILAILCLVFIQIIKGIGIVACMHDIEDEWDRQMHTTIGLTSKFAVLGFIPFVRVIALYALNKPLSTMVTFYGVTSEDTDDGDTFVEDSDDDDDDDDDDEEYEDY